MNLFKLTATLGLNTTDYEKNVEKAGRSSATLKGKLQQAGQSALATRNRIKQLSSEYAAANTNVAALTAAYNKSAKASGLTSKETRELGEQLKAAEAKASGLKGELDQLTAASHRSGESMKKVGKGVLDFHVKAFGKTVKLMAKATALAAAGIATMVGKSVQAYSDYEQLVGGVETLFGESAMKVQAYAQGAYKTAGLSANEYMETVTSFSASLLQSLGGDTAAAAEYADLAITDMSDNANKMGTDMGSIQHAYQGFAKMNYTMLDNLKLGYGGTKEEMKRLLSDAEALAGKKFDLSSYADIVEAIHVIQGEMKISGRSAEEAAEIIARTGRSSEDVMEQQGTTAKEASTTIQGSLHSMKSAFDNLLVSMAGGGPGVKVAMTSMVNSITTFSQNAMPVIHEAMGGVIQLIEGVVPQLVAAIPHLLNDTLPQLLEAAIFLLTSVLQGIVDNADLIVKTAVNMVDTLAKGLIKALPLLLEAGSKIILGLLNEISANPDAFLETAGQLILAFLQGIVSMYPQVISTAVAVVFKLIQSIIKHLPDILETGWELVKELGRGIWEEVPTIWQAGEDLVQGIADGIADAWDSLVEWFQGLWDSLFGDLGVNIGVGGDTQGSSYAQGGTTNSSGGYDPGSFANIDGSHANGLGYVPFDGYIAQLHKGERVLTASQNRRYGGADDRPINIVVQSVLDGRVIGETAYKYSRQKARALG